MKLSIYTCIAFLVTLSAVPVTAKKNPDSADKRYKVVLEDLKPPAESAANEEVRQPTASATRDTSKDSETDTEEAAEANSRKWWKLWGGNEPASEAKKKKVEAVNEPAQDKGKKWWQLWQ